MFSLLAFETDSSVFLFCLSFSVCLKVGEKLPFPVLKGCPCVEVSLCSLHVLLGFGGRVGSDVSMGLPLGHSGSSHLGGR